MLNKIAFTMYPVTDMKRALNFYEENLALIPSGISANGAWVEYDLPAGGCFVLTTLAKGVESSNVEGGRVAFEVDDIESLIKKLKANHVRFKLDLFNTPVCKMAVMVDSEGNGLMLHQLLRKSPALKKQKKKQKKQKKRKK